MMEEMVDYSTISSVKEYTSLRTYFLVYLPS